MVEIVGGTIKFKELRCCIKGQNIILGYFFIHIQESFQVEEKGQGK